ncbi:hypothetical protein GW17_00046443, partial [Ensete ventricosum]
MVAPSTSPRHFGLLREPTSLAPTTRSFFSLLQAQSCRNFISTHCLQPHSILLSTAPHPTVAPSHVAPVAISQLLLSNDSNSWGVTPTIAVISAAPFFIAGVIRSCGIFSSSVAEERCSFSLRPWIRAENQEPGVEALGIPFWQQAFIVELAHCNLPRCFSFIYALIV